MKTMLIALALALVAGGASAGPLGDTPQMVQETTDFLAKCADRNLTDFISKGWRSRRMLIVQAQAMCVAPSGSAVRENAEADMVGMYINKWLSENQKMSAKFPAKWR